MAEPRDLTLTLSARDPELRTIEAVLIVLDQVDATTRNRILTYICLRYGLVVVTGAALSEKRQ